MVVQVTTDETTGMSYYRLSEKSVARTDHVDDLIMVDLDDDESVIGVELPLPVDRMPHTELEPLWERYPALVSLLQDDQGDSPYKMRLFPSTELRLMFRDVSFTRRVVEGISVPDSGSSLTLH